jgi:Protein of unknown function (DUF1616)
LSVEKTVLITALGLIAAFLIIAAGLIWAYWPKSEEQFIELGLLGRNKMAEDFFQNSNSTVTVNSQNDWYIFIHNHMENSQNILIKVKLLNSTMEIPDDQEHKPSPYASFAEFPISLSNNETLLFPFSWSITGLDYVGGSVVLRQMMINEATTNINVTTSSTSYFQMVFELWVYNNSSEEYDFGWTSGEGFSSASLHIGFRVA